MKCHCKYCSPRFFCQTTNEEDLCYYRYAVKVNDTNDFGCIQADVARFLCNTTDANYRTECCSSFFCNVNYRVTTRISTSTIENEHHYSTSIIITVGAIFIVALVVIISYYSCKRTKDRTVCFLSAFERFRIPRSSKSNPITDDDNSSQIQRRSSLLSPVDTISWHCESSDHQNKTVPLETRRVNKEITFLGQLGQGRHARVRLGLINQQYRAIKMFETRFQNEFERERAIFQTDLIQHPNILGFFGADFFAKGTDTCHMLIFEWHPLGTLYDVLKDKQIVTIERLLRYSISLCDGLAHLHLMKYGTNDVCKPQMAHCDIKSSNILVKVNGDCCLSDFSLAVRCDPHTKDIQGGGLDRLYHRVGTKLYMPPELLDRHGPFHFDRINAYQQGDMYSLALVLWEIGNCCCSFTHLRPYENQLPSDFNVEHLIQLICVEEKRPVSCINPSDELLASFFDLLAFYWCQDPCARQSAANLQDQLRQLCPINISF